MTPAEKILSKSLAASGLPSSEWSRVQAGLRDRAFFSATVESARVLHAMRGASARVADEGISESDARKAIREALAAEGIGSPEGKEGGIQDLHSRRRLDLVIRHNVESARCYVQRREGLLPGAFLAFPAQELVRIEDRHDKRDWRARWKAQGGKFYGDYRMAALKTDPIWAAISRFGQPWPPFDFGSGMGLRDIGYEEAVALGIIKDGEKLELPKEEDFNAGLSARLPEGHEKEMDSFLREAFGAQVSIVNNEVHWNEHLIRDMLKGTGNENARLGKGCYNRRMLSRIPNAAMREKAEKTGVTISRQWMETHAQKHRNPSGKGGRNLPLNDGDFELIPSLWRNPDGVAIHSEDELELWIETLDGGRLKLGVNIGHGRPTTFHKEKP